MSQISAAMVKELRDRTNLPMMDCKAALTEANGDMDKAIQILREKNAKVSIKRGDRETAEGRIAAYIDPAQNVGAIIELRCESPMVVKADAFVQLANELAKHVATNNPATVDEMLAQSFDGAKTVKQRIDEAIGLIRENMTIKRFSRQTGVLGEYCHHDGTVGVMLVVTGADKADPVALRDVCAHIAALQPAYLKPGDVPAEVADREKAFAKQQANEQAAGKPPGVIDKIAEGRFRTWLEENVLTEQPIANQMKYGKKAVKDVLKSAGVVASKFIRYRVGDLT
jgi:elongation factor Ts